VKVKQITVILGAIFGEGTAGEKHQGKEGNQFFHFALRFFPSGEIWAGTWVAE
jgi:hypothetical protein